MPAYLLPGATDFLATASWSDGIGPADNAELIIPAGSQTLTNLNALAAAPNGIHYIYISPGFTGNIGGGGTSLQLIFDATYTSGPNVVFEGSGFMYLNVSGTCAQVTNAGIGTYTQTGGTVTNTRSVSGQTVIGPSATATNVYGLGSGSIEVQYSASLVVTLLQVNGSGNVSLARQTTTYTINGPSTGIINAPGETVATLNLNNPGGRVILQAADITTAALFGPIDFGQLQRASTVGGTSVTVYPGGRIYGNGNPLLTLSNVSYVAGGSMAGAGESTP